MVAGEASDHRFRSDLRQFPRRYIPTPLTPPSACLYATTERGNGTTELRGGSNSQGSPCREAREWGESTWDGLVWCQE